MALVAPPLAPELTAFRPRIRKLAGKRATIAHGRWGINDHYPNDIILAPTFGDHTRWSAKDFDNRAKEFHALRSDFIKFELKLREAAKARPGLEPSPVPLEPMPEPQQPK